MFFIYKICLGGHDDDGSGLTIGAIFFIALAVIFFVYLLTFSALNKFKNGANGIEIVPHRRFWMSLPGLIRDGFKFTFYKITRRSAYNQYQ